MKNKFLNFLKKYLICILLSVIMVVGIILSTCFADVYVDDNSMIRFNLRDYYLVYGLPLYSVIYGCISYIKTKNIWFPHLILCLVSFLYWFRFDVDTLAWPGTFIWSFLPVIFSIIGTLITAFIYCIIKLVKKK